METMRKRLDVLEARQAVMGHRLRWWRGAAVLLLVAGSVLGSLRPGKAADSGPGLDARVSALEAAASNQANQIAALQAADTAQANQIAALQAAGTSQASQIAALQATDTSQASQIASLQVTDTSQATSIANLQTAVSNGANAQQASDIGLANAIDGLQSRESTQDNQIAGLQTAVVSLQYLVVPVFGGAEPLIQPLDGGILINGTLRAGGDISSCGSVSDNVHGGVAHADLTSLRSTGCP
jgi:hypothetical protein